MRNPSKHVHWSEAFGRSTIGPVAWTDRHHLGDLSGAPGSSGGSMFSGYRKSKDYADSGWDHYGNYTWSDAPQRGERIYGWATLRFLCAINGIEAPSRRLKGEPFVPDTRLLVETVWEQLVIGSADLRPERGSDPNDLLVRSSMLHELGPTAVDFWVRLAEKHAKAGVAPYEGVTL